MKELRNNNTLSNGTQQEKFREISEPDINILKERKEGWREEKGGRRILKMEFIVIVIW